MELIEAEKEIIESKKNDGPSIKKEQAWNKITCQFNSRNGVTERTQKQLKDAWKNIKMKAKKEFAEQKKEYRKTGGGKVDDHLSDISQKVISLLPQQINSLHNPFDTDAQFQGDHESSTNEVNYVCPCEICKMIMLLG